VQGKAVKTLRAMQIYKKQKIVTNYAFFSSETMLTSKIIPEFIENHSEVSECSKSCNKFVSVRSWQTMKLACL